MDTNGVITAGNVGSATISGMLNGVTGTSERSQVPDQPADHHAAADGLL